MLKKLLIAFGLFVGLTASGCGLYFDDGSGGDTPSPGPGGGSGGSGGTTPPGTTPPGYACDGDAQCAAGCYCSPDGTCVEGGFCNRDDQCGDGLTCDEARNSCDPQGGGTCGGEVTCNEVAPRCEPDSVPIIENGCWTGDCQPLALCDVEPTCERINTEASCLARADRCGAVYSGQNCRRQDGTACRAGDTGCTCDRYDFASCRTK